MELIYVPSRQINRPAVQSFLKRAGLDGRADRPAQPWLKDVFFVVCDGLRGQPDTVSAVFPLAIVQACGIYLVGGHDCSTA